MSEQRDMSGALFKNRRKEQDKHPDYTGKSMIDGYEYQVSAWVKTSKSGDKFMSLSYQLTKREDHQAPRVHNLDDDIPF